MIKLIWENLYLKDMSLVHFIYEAFETKIMISKYVQNYQRFSEQFLT